MGLLATALEFMGATTARCEEAEKVRERHARVAHKEGTKKEVLDEKLPPPVFFA